MPRGHRWPWVWAGGVVAFIGAVLLGVALSKEGAWGAALGLFGLISLGWGGLVAALQGLLVGPGQVQALGLAVPLPAALPWLIAGGLVWLAGWGLMALGIRGKRDFFADPSPAIGAPLYARLDAYRDFSWVTLAAYGGGIFLAECVMMLLQTWLSSGVQLGESEADGGFFSLAPTSAFGLAILVGGGLAFLAGFLGASRAEKLAVPEATIGVLYLGLPLPLLLTLVGVIPGLQAAFGASLREVTYVASLLGRPEVGYWLVFTFLVLALVLGMNTGFVVGGSGRADYRSGYELFIARRHVSVFRPRLLLGTLAVLLLGIVPPLLLFGIIRAAEAAVERTRIRKLGLRDPLAAAAAQDELKRREQTPTGMMTALSVGGVGVGVMALIIVLSVMSGFEADLQQKILGTNAHAVVHKYGVLEEYKDVMAKIQKVPGVIGVTPMIMNEVMISSDGNMSGTVIKGIDPDTVGTVTDLPKNILRGGSMEALKDPKLLLRKRIGAPGREGVDERPAEGGQEKGSGEDDIDLDDMIIRQPSAPQEEAVLPGILVGRELASLLRVVVGDRVNVVSPLSGELGPQGPVPKTRPFRVAGIFYTGMYEYDSKFVYILLEEAQQFFNIDGALGIELKVDDIDDARRISRTVLERLEGYPYRVKDWGEMNRNLFSALRLEKLVMGIILSIIIIVAAGLIVATVIMLVLEKRKEISVLKALGVPDGGIVKIFLAEGLQIGVAGGLLGLIAGLAWCFLIEAVGIKLDPEVYYIPALPVRIEPLQTALAVIIAVLVTYLASIYPALKASRVEPVEGLKAE